MIDWLDNLIHHPRMGWLPRPLTSWICDLQDHALGMTWAQIRRARHGKSPGYVNGLDWRSGTTNSTLGNQVVIHYKSGERA
jgi:hypothetical protein